MTWTNSTDAPWWTRAVVYQIYPRSFADSNSDGFGDLGGIISKVDYLADLGVDVIWLSPVYPSPQHDNGYDISDYQNIDPLFGDLEQFDQLLAGAHERGIKIIMDLVVNHTSDEHPWFLESRSSKDSPKRDWYWWRPPRDGFDAGQPGAEPTNWQSAFSGPAWHLDEATGEYYLHLFARQQPDLNWENPEVRAAVYEMMNWWLDRGVDGFRMDVINYISKSGLRDGPPIEGTNLGDGSALFMSGPRIHEFMQEMVREVFEGRDAELLTVGEMPGVTVEDARLFTAPERKELDMVFQFEHVGLDHGPGGKWDPQTLDLPVLKASLNRWQVELASSGWNSLYLNNHDQPRLVSRFGHDGQAPRDPENTGLYRYESATLWAAVLHLHRGTPYIYQGEEIGMTNMPFADIEDFRDIEAINHYADVVTARGADPDDVLQALGTMGRDNARTPVQWDASRHAGFTDAEPWIAVNPNYPDINTVSDRQGHKSVFRFYQQLIWLRHKLDVVALGTFNMLEPEHPALYAFERTLDGERLLITANVSSDPLEVPLQLPAGPVLLGNYDGEAGTSTLRPWEVRVYLEKNR
ncbi:glycoside hydrolase family 13 protein [Arthrobacter sp. H14]|uniref:glycoside hydrolase family 13 protein n=1 Tax=Arthrobacter sp. H14 TaxID=1312959 RepID=UPI000478FE0D|nr:alpha-glucosidase [Arthrobacter sp. H14]